MIRDIITKQLLLFFALLLTTTTAAHSQVSYKADAPMVVEPGQRFLVSFTLTNATGSEFTEPQFKNASVLAGPIPATGANFAIINGKQTGFTTYKLTYTLKAPASGNIRVGETKLKGTDEKNSTKTYSTKAFSIEVTAGLSSTSSPQAAMTGRPRGAATMSPDDIILRVDVDKKTVYKGQALTATLAVCTRVGIAGFESPKYAAFNGFWAQELTVGNNQMKRVEINNKVYESIPLRQWLLYPQRTGNLEIEQNSFVAIAQMTTHASGNSLFDEFFGGSILTEHIKKQLVSPPVKITVLDTPKPTPPTFFGAVGQFKLEASISANSIPANSAGSITLKLSGNGNFPMITPPEMQLPTGFEKYDTKTTDEIKNSLEGSIGTRTWEFPFITRAEGDYTIPPIDITYFDPHSKSYRTLSSGKFDVKITRDDGSSNTAGAFISGVSKEDLKMLGQDIRFIKVTKPRLLTDKNLLIWSPTFFTLLGVMIAIFIATLYMSRRMIAAREDVARTKNKRANKVALRRLKKAKTYMQGGHQDKFFEEMLRALWGYMGDKLTIEVADLTKERVQSELLERGVTQDQATLFLELIGQCEMAQYAPSVAVPMEQAYNQALEVIGSMELR